MRQSTVRPKSLISQSIICMAVGNIFAISVRISVRTDDGILSRSPFLISISKCQPDQRRTLPSGFAPSHRNSVIVGCRLSRFLVIRDVIIKMHSTTLTRNGERKKICDVIANYFQGIGYNEVPDVNHTQHKKRRRKNWFEIDTGPKHVYEGSGQDSLTLGIYSIIGKSRTINR